ncbi:hypothetical protein PAUR_a1721 [Pseudoalteromonas aurantia 208]|uniref:Uncharacterized protein n=1 Tax=Pseudoalteromonas aurantia 208 TaxID=1314867 RepID=A0ABR9EB01_9GAMM|nr:hypothetical protein [Pseudoalteromonas aurantia 208]
MAGQIHSASQHSTSQQSSLELVVVVKLSAEMLAVSITE